MHYKRKEHKCKQCGQKHEKGYFKKYCQKCQKQIKSQTIKKAKREHKALKLRWKQYKIKGQPPKTTLEIEEENEPKKSENKQEEKYQYKKTTKGISIEGLTKALNEYNHKKETIQEYIQKRGIQ